MKKLIIGLSVAAMLAPFAAFAAVDNVSITLDGSAVSVQQGQSYVEPGYSANSTVDGNITWSVIVSGVDTSMPGTHAVGYSVTDSDNVSAFASRTLIVMAGGGTLPYCSGPTAPGWRMDLADGGCGQGAMKILAPGTPGCAFFNVLGCVVKE